MSYGKFYMLAYSQPIHNPFIWAKREYALNWAGKVKAFVPVGLIVIRPKTAKAAEYFEANCWGLNWKETRQ